VERHRFGLKVKNVDDAGKFTGIGAVYNNVDLGGDNILPGAFIRTLTARKQFPILWQHNPSDPIGIANVIDTSQGLIVEGQLLLSDPTATKAHQLLKAGIIKGMSIGYETIKSALVDNVRELKELKLWEISIVTFPMNEAAMVTGVKAMSDDDRSRHLKAINEHRKAIDKHQRGIQTHLKAMLVLDDSGLADVFKDESDEDISKAFCVELRKLAEQASALI
jgi:HK97 family phage prohead protease